MSVPLLAAQGLSVGYGATPVVSELDLEVHPGEVVALLGRNGAGKTTTLLGLAGELRPIAGTVWWQGEPLHGPLHQRSRRGLGFVTEEKSVIFALSVLDNLRLGRGNVDRAFELFPELVPLRRRIAGTLSGGEQQILTFARALSRSPKVLLADELSLGLAPVIVGRLTRALREAADAGLGVLLVEQRVHSALACSDRAYVLGGGRVVLTGASKDLLGRLDEIETSYLAGGEPARSATDPTQPPSSRWTPAPRSPEGAAESNSADSAEPRRKARFTQALSAMAWIVPGYVHPELGPPDADPKP